MSFDSFFSRFNPLVAGVLRSPLHFLMSRGLMLITVTGRRSGRRFTFPVGYQRYGDSLVVMVSEAASKNWWRNFKEPRQVELCLRGVVRYGEAERVAADSAEFETDVRRSLKRMPWLGRVFHIHYDAKRGLTDAQVRALGRTIVAVRIRLQPLEANRSRTERRWYPMRPVDLDFLKTAGVVYTMECELRASRKAVWETYVDASTWHAWFPGVREARYREQEGPIGVGSIREASVSGQAYEEQMVAWEEGRRWAYTLTRATFPIAHAQLECTEFEDCGSGTRVRWILAADRRFLMWISAPFLKRRLERLWREAVESLDRYIALRA